MREQMVFDKKSQDGKVAQAMVSVSQEGEKQELPSARWGR